MRLVIDWTLFLEVTTQQKCEKIIDQIAELTGCELSKPKIERYWKDETTFKVRAQSCFHAPTAADGFYLTMCKLNHLAHTWIITGPPEEDPGQFNGATQPSTIKVRGVHAIFFEATSDAGVPSPVPA